MNLKEVGYRIKLCRKEKNFTQERLAEEINVSPHYIYEIERGSKNMSIYTLDKISKALNISTDYILSCSEKEFPTSNDNLSLIVEKIPFKKRENVANVLSVLLPYLK